jgi:hypothetical protein
MFSSNRNNIRKGRVDITRSTAIGLSKTSIIIICTTVSGAGRILRGSIRLLLDLFPRAKRSIRQETKQSIVVEYIIII